MFPPKRILIEPPWYGSVCRVVWEGRRREASPYPDLWPIAVARLRSGERREPAYSGLFLLRFERQEDIPRQLPELAVAGRDQQHTVGGGDRVRVDRAALRLDAI